MTTRFLNPSPRILIKDDDNRETYPAISQKSGKLDIDEDDPYFDKDTQIFSARSVLFPYMTTAAEAEFLTGTLTATVIPRSHSQYLGKNSRISGSFISPFNETFNPVSQTSTFANVLGITEDEFKAGYPTGSYPGFFNPIDDKIAISFDISNTTEIELFRDLGANTYNGSAQGSGFYYFNFNSKIWQDVKPGAAGQIPYRDGNKISFDSLANVYSQFTNTPNIASIAYATGALATQDDLRAAGYDKIGIPTIVYGAPNNSKYHALDNQTIALKNYIDRPFVLEKIFVELPVTTKRKQRNVDTWNNILAGSAMEGHARDMDNHSFFIYLQHRTTSTIDSQSDITGSRRELVAHSSMCFYNRPSLGYLQPVHIPNYLYEYTAQEPGDVGTLIVDHNVKMMFRPKVYNRQFGNITHMGSVHASIDTTLQSLSSSFILNFWPGGTSPYITEPAQPKEDVFGTIFSTKTAIANSGETSLFDIDNVVTSFKGRRPTEQTTEYLKTTSRTLRHGIPNSTNSLIKSRFFKKAVYPIGGTPPDDPAAVEEAQKFPNFPSQIASGSQLEFKSNIDNYYETPFILLPTDSLILGIENGTFHNPAINYESNIAFAPIPSPSSDGTWPLAFRQARRGFDYPSTGSSDDSSRAARKNSQLFIRAGFARVVLYGSYVKDDKQYLQSLDQQLNTAAVHEDLHYDNVVADQFDILDSVSYTADAITSGTMRIQTIEFENELSYDTGKKYKVVVNKRKYSQFNDLLLQPKYSKSKYNKLLNKGNYSPLLTIGSALVICSFVSASSNTSISANLTQCSNLSPFATSSLPFDDISVIGTNRDATPTITKTPFAPTTLVFGKKF